MKKYITIKKCIICFSIIILCCLIGIIVIVKFNSFHKIKAQEYRLIESYVLYEFKADNPEDIELVEELFNSNKFYKTISWADTLNSPDVIISFEKKDGSKEKMGVYGGAWTGEYYLIVDDVQYRIENPDKFYEELEEVSEQINKK